MNRDLRTPGEVAFDRCILPFALFFLFPSFINVQSLWKKIPPQLQWISLLIAPLIVVLWGRALVSLIKGWSDPSAKILRVVALVLLLLWTPVFYLASQWLVHGILLFFR